MAVVLLLLPPVSAVIFYVAVRCLCDTAARKLTALSQQFACPPSSSFRRYELSGSAVEKKDDDEHQLHHAIRGLPPVARYYRRRKKRSCCVGVGEDEEEEAEQCVFCLSGIEEGEETRELKCRHLFHRGCLDRWLLARPLLATCPLCRCRLLPPQSPSVSVCAPWEVDYYDDDAGGEEGEDEEDSNVMLFMACVHSRSSWLWPS